LADADTTLPRTIIGAPAVAPVVAPVVAPLADVLAPLAAAESAMAPDADALSYAEDRFERLQAATASAATASAAI
jgi:hypothetical protein